MCIGVIIVDKGLGTLNEDYQRLLNNHEKLKLVICKACFKKTVVNRTNSIL